MEENRLAFWRDDDGEDDPENEAGMVDAVERTGEWALDQSQRTTGG